MTTPINPAAGTPIQRTSTDKPKTPAPSSETFTVPTGTADTVDTQSSNLSFGSLRPLINTQLTNETAITTAQQTGQQLGSQSLPVVNNRPHVVSNLIETLDAHNHG